MTAIRHLAVSRNGSLLAAAEFESVVHLWDLDSLIPLRTFATTLDFGGNRLAVSPDGESIAVGAYHRHGIAIYRTSDGSELWRRKDLKKVQRLGFSHDGQRIICCFDGSSCEQLNSADGRSGKTIRGVRNFWTSGFGPHYLWQRERDYLLTEAESKIAVIPKTTFAGLSAAFSTTSVCLAEAGGPVRLFSLESGEMLWRYDAHNGTHFSKLAYQKSTDHFVGVLRHFETGGNFTLCCFDRETGEACPLAEVPQSWTSVFWRDGSRLITSSGAVIDACTGCIEASLNFPPKPPKVRIS